MTLAEFYRNLEVAWAVAGLTVVQRQPIIRGDPTQGWRWLLRKGGDAASDKWVSFNADGLLPSQRQEDAYGSMRREPPDVQHRTPVHDDDEAVQVIAEQVIGRLQTDG
jgi:hypothetical protein